MAHKIFVTATNTDTGKTYVSTGLLKALNQNNYRTVGLKPLASGCIQTKNGLCSEDALALQAAASVRLPLHVINPFAFEPAIAPHIAAMQQGLALNLAALCAQMQPAFHYPADIYLIEGAGGLYLPLNHQETMAEFIIAEQCKVILVVGMRLGCINHALLTARAMQADGLQVLGWIANCLDPSMLSLNENIAALKQMLPIPCLAVLPYGGQMEHELDARFFQLIQI
jgi:dethiobiotin synthetase